MQLTLQRAEGFIALNTYDGQRKQNNTHIKRLKEEILNGNFIDGYIVVARMNGKKFLMNGQHQCRSVMETKLPVHVFFSEWSCDDANDLSHLYNHLDQESPRGIGDCTRTKAASLGITWGGRVKSLIVSAAALNENMRCAPRDDRAALIGKYRAEGDFLNDLIVNNSERSKHLLKQTVVLAIILTYQSFPEGAHIFWKRVRDGENLKKDMPEYHLQRFLLGARVTNHFYKINGERCETTTQNEIYSKCIYAWNCFRRSKKIMALKYDPTTQIEVA